MAKRLKLYPVILAGGSGTRFWPLSRKRRPKQLLALSGRKPLLVETLARVRGVAAPRDALIVCGALHEREIRRLLPALPRANLLVEPVPRNTAAAIGWAAVRLLARDKDATLAILPSDHHIADVPRFRTLLRAAATVAQDGTLVTLGVTPTAPDTGFGYLRMGEPMAGAPAGARRVAAFVEKPTLEVAQGYLKAGTYLWNAGIFIFRADAVLAEIRRQLPELALVLSKIEAVAGEPREAAVIAKAFPAAPSISIDYGVMEKASRVAVIPADFGWSDLGSFDALPQVRPTDAKGNLLEGEAVAIDCRDCIVLAGKRPVAVIGAEGLVVVDAGDALLVVPRSRVQDVRKAVAELEKRRLHDVL